MSEAQAPTHRLIVLAQQLRGEADKLPFMPAGLRASLTAAADWITEASNEIEACKRANEASTTAEAGLLEAVAALDARLTAAGH